MFIVLSYLAYRNQSLAAKNVLGALHFNAGHAVRTADVNQSTAADIVLLEAVGDFIGDVERLINQVGDDGLFELVVGGLREEIHLAGGAVGIKTKRFQYFQLQELGAFARPFTNIFIGFIKI